MSGVMKYAKKAKKTHQNQPKQQIWLSIVTKRVTKFTKI